MRREFGVYARVIIAPNAVLAQPATLLGLLADQLKPLHCVEGQINRKIVEVVGEGDAAGGIKGLDHHVDHVLRCDGPRLIPDQPRDVFGPMTQPGIFKVEPAQFLVAANCGIA